MSYADDYERARALFKAFQHREAKPSEIVAIESIPRPRVILEIGRIERLDYHALGDGVHYFHEFEGVLPRLFVSPRGEQFFAIGGSYRFTPRGFLK